MGEGMRLSSSCVRFSLGEIPVVGNVETGAIVGLTAEGAQLCDAMRERDVPIQDVPDSCSDLIGYLRSAGFVGEASDGRRVDAVTHGPHRISSAYLHVTNCCNLSCVGCYSRDDARNRAADPSCDELCHALDLLAALGVKRLVISGGEPFIRRDLPELLRRARGNGVSYIAIITNGTLLTWEMVNSLKGLVDVISISFDGASAQSPAYIRKMQLFDALVDAVHLVQDAGIRAHILPTLHARNTDDVPAYLALAEKLGVTVGFSLLSGGTRELGALCMTAGCLVELAERMEAVTLSQAETDALGEDVWSGALRARVRCGAGRTNISVAADGSVYPCHMLHYPELKLGNAFTDTADALQEALSSFHLPVVDEIDGCRSCEKRYLCGGGCRGRSMAEYGRLDARDPYCAYYNHAIDLAVDAFVRTVTARKG